MTTRLLTRSGHAPGRRTLREALSATSLIPFLRLGVGTSISGAALPLFRRRPDGGLDQVVRLAFEQPLPDPERIEVRRPDGKLAVSWTGRIPAHGVLDLLVPEITAESAWRVAVTVAGVEYAGELAVAPGRKLTVHLVHHSHLDIGYTDRQGVVLRHQEEYLDAAVELARQNADDGDPDTWFRWTVESNLPVRSWLRHRPTSVVEEFSRLAREDIVEVTAMPFNLHTEMASQEELARLLRSVFEFRERYGIPVTSAMHTDVPGATTGWVDALVDAGVRYLSAAHNWAGRSVPYLVGGQELSRPFWWCTPGGSRLLTWFTDSAHGAAYLEGNLVGLSNSYDEVIDLLPLYLQALVSKPFPYYDAVFGLSGIPDGADITRQPYAFDLLQLRVQGDHSDNAGPSATPARIAAQWNAEWAYPRLVSATNTSFLAEVERTIGDRLAEHTGDWGDWWADGVGAGARPLGHNRRTQATLRTAETLHTLADLHSGSPMPVREVVDEIYDKVGLFDEHTWGAANPWHDRERGADSGALQWTRKSEYAYQAYDEALDLLHSGIRRLGAGFGVPPFTDVAGSLAVYNTTGWARTDVVRSFLPESQFPLGIRRLGVVDPRTDERVPVRINAERRPAAPRGWHVEFVARDVPPLGWARFDLVPVDEDPFSNEETGAGSVGVGPSELVAASATAGAISGHGFGDSSLGVGPDGLPVMPAPKAAYRMANEFYELTYDPAQAMVTSIVDRRTGRELVNPDALTGLNEYIYDTYGSASRVNRLSSRVEARDLTLLTSRQLAGNAVVLNVEHSAVGDFLEVEVRAPGVDWIRTTISLYSGVPRVEITNRVSKRASTTKESGFFAFPLAGNSEPVYELTGSVAGAGISHVPGTPHHMHAIRHWVGVSEDGCATVWATLEAPLVEFGTIALPYQPYPSTLVLERPEPATVYSWVFNNIWDTNFPSQQEGEMTFSYAVTSSADQAVESLGAMTAAALTEPLVGVLGNGRGVAPLVSSGSLLTLSRSEVVVSSVARPLDGSAGVAIRLRSLASEPVEVEVVLEAFDAATAQVTTPWEREGVEVVVENGRVWFEIPAGASRTLLLRR
ncbi:glycoside hydrolase family 38 C-terminal domain-containing protein [Actinopolymorpha alba]|uniref:glycoside hydrolase family 38 N-terminal domain-containing protein n=1 Tax=Actinopolymorpha alba TaxID=533267 RepID=UPI00047667EF|nr:glycoside hydrolase family 38 C-terminal domain-containing protein [Actinopolymorpha alba]